MTTKTAATNTMLRNRLDLIEDRCDTIDALEMMLILMIGREHVITESLKEARADIQKAVEECRTLT